MPHAIIVEAVDQDFHPEPRLHEGSHNDAPKYVTTPACIIIIGAEALGFCTEKPSPIKYYFRMPTITESGSQNAIWELSMLYAQTNISSQCLVFPY